MFVSGGFLWIGIKTVLPVPQPIYSGGLSRCSPMLRTGSLDTPSPVFVRNDEMPAIPWRQLRNDPVNKQPE